MTKEEMIKAAEIHFKEPTPCDICPYKDEDNCVDSLLEDMLAYIKPSYKTQNSPSDARKGEGWSTISVDENVGSNAAISAADAIVKMGEAFDLFAKATADMLRNKE